jgi:hypothetical protein
MPGYFVRVSSRVKFSSSSSYPTYFCDIMRVYARVPALGEYNRAPKRFQSLDSTEFRISFILRWVVSL